MNNDQLAMINGNCGKVSADSAVKVSVLSDFYGLLMLDFLAAMFTA
jgi:hypothetical protein